MCGIAGILNAGGARRSAVVAMTEIQAHRGPDGDGIWTSPDRRCVLGHRRLAIIDLTEAGAQPMTVGRLTITYNGEIYNYLEVRDDLKRLGRQFRSESDTEVILQAYEEWGTGFLQRLNGMFAFAIWDEAAGELFCVRDRFGEKPFVYAVTRDQFAFASEVKALALLAETDVSIDDGVMAGYFVDGSTSIDSSERTLLRGVRQLMPGHAMKVSVRDGCVDASNAKPYWCVDLQSRPEPGTVSPARTAEELISLLTDSIRLRLRSDVPVGSCLSGGLDSSAVVSLIRRIDPTADLRTFTGRFPSDPLDEGAYADLVRTSVHGIGYEVSPTPERFVREAERFFWHAEFPVGGMSQFAQWCVFHLASENGVTVLLDGQGSDELFGGYGSEIASAYIRQLKAIGQWRLALRERRAWAKSAPWLLSWPRILGRTSLGRPATSLVRRILGKTDQAAAIAKEDWLQNAKLERPDRESYESLPDRYSLSRTLYRLSFRTMLSSLLRFGDRLSMAHSREVRLPFCDSRIAEFAFRLPPEHLMGGGQVKRVLRHAASGVVPDAIVQRKKQGFAPPQRRWILEEPMAGFIRQLVDTHAGSLADFLDVQSIRTLVTAPLEQRARNVDALWHVTNLMGWSTFFLERVSHLARVSGAAQN